MAVKDVKKYYEEVTSQYMEMRDELREFEKLAEENMFEPERIDAIKESIQPLMRNYEVLSYVMYLLNKPSRKSKEKAYEKRSRKILNEVTEKNTEKGVLQENCDVINNLRQSKKSLQS